MTVIVWKLSAVNSEQKLQQQRAQLPHSQLSLQNTYESEGEVREQEEIHTKLFAYTVQKYTAKHSNSILSDIRQQGSTQLLRQWNWNWKS